MCLVEVRKREEKREKERDKREKRQVARSSFLRPLFLLSTSTLIIIIPP